MRRLLTLVSIVGCLTSCFDNDRGGPWSISEDGDSVVAEDIAEDSATTGPDFVGEAFNLATALERVAVIARDQNSSLCVFIVLVWPGDPATYTDVVMPEEWGVESIVARPEGCPDPSWPAREGLQPEAAAGHIDLYQSMGVDRWTSVSVDLSLGFPENERDVPRQIVLDFPLLEL